MCGAGMRAGRSRALLLNLGIIKVIIASFAPGENKGKGCATVPPCLSHEGPCNEQAKSRSLGHLLQRQQPQYESQEAACMSA